MKLVTTYNIKVNDSGVLNDSIDLLSYVYTFKELSIEHQVVSKTNIFPRIRQVFKIFY